MTRKGKNGVLGRKPGKVLVLGPVALRLRYPESLGNSSPFHSQQSQTLPSPGSTMWMWPQAPPWLSVYAVALGSTARCASQEL